MLLWIGSATVLTALMIALRYILRGRIVACAQYALWLLLLVRLLVPVNFGHSPLSIANLLIHNTTFVQAIVTEGRSSSGAMAQTEQIPSSFGHIIISHFGTDSATVEWKTIEPETLSVYDPQHFSLRQLLLAIWLTGAALTALWWFSSNIHLCIILRKTRQPLEGVNCTLPVYITNAIDTPCLAGLVRPGIYLTAEAAQKEDVLQYVLAHELTHVRHGDSLWSLLRGLCIVIHWYNPLVWWAALLSRRDAELACDEGTIRYLGESHRLDYGKTLIQLSCRRPSRLPSLSSTMIGERHSLQERIQMLTLRPKNGILVWFCVIVFVLTITGCTFTGAKEESLVPVSSAPDYLVTWNSNTELPFDPESKVLTFQMTEGELYYSGNRFIPYTFLQSFTAYDYETGSSSSVTLYPTLSLEKPETLVEIFALPVRCDQLQQIQFPEESSIFFQLYPGADCSGIPVEMDALQFMDFCLHPDTNIHLVRAIVTMPMEIISENGDTTQVTWNCLFLLESGVDTGVSSITADTGT